VSRLIRSHEKLIAIEHGRRRIVRFEVTDHPAAAWVIQRLREAFPFDAAPRHLIFDRDSIFSASVVSTVKSFGTKPTRTAPRSPWQNGVADRSSFPCGGFLWDPEGRLVFAYNGTSDNTTHVARLKLR